MDRPAPVVLVVQHTATCPPGLVGEELRAAGVRLDVRVPFAGEALPADLDGIAGLVVLGGQMGAYDDAAHSWLGPTKARLAEAVARELPALGICLGHQLLAVATGGRVTAAPTGQQGGVLPVGRTTAGTEDPLLGPLAPGVRGVHWNHDLVVDLPPAAVELARSPAGVQAIRVGRAAWGVQWHPEVDAAVVRPWAAEEVAAGELDAATAQRWLGQVEAAEPELRTTWATFTRSFAGLVGGQVQELPPAPAAPAPGAA